MSGYGNLSAVLRSATPLEWSAGLSWYPNARELCARLAADTHHSYGWACDVVALTSPQTAWADNIAIAKTILQGEHHPSLCGRQYSQISCARSLGFLSAVKRGYKIKAFRQNLLGNESVACVDTHILRAWLGDATINGNSSIIKRRFDSQNLYLEVATDIEILAAHYSLTPAQCQAIIWTTWRNRHTRPHHNSPKDYSHDAA